MRFGNHWQQLLYRVENNALVFIVLLISENSEQPIILLNFNIIQFNFLLVIRIEELG